MNMFPLLEKMKLLDIMPLRVSTQCLRQRNYPHMHEYPQLCYVLSGTLRHTINGTEYIQTADSCAIIRPFVWHMTDLFDSEDTPVVVFITFHADFLTSHGYDFFPFCGDSAHFEEYAIPETFKFSDDRARELIHTLLSEFSPDGDMPFESIAKHIAELFVLAADGNTTKRASLALKNRVADILTAVKYTGQHYAEKLSIDDVANIINMSRSTFTSNLRFVTGLSFSELLASIRLQSAISLYNVPIDEIAKRTGLNDRTNLTRVFKKHFGMTLNELHNFRKNNSSPPKQKNNSLTDWVYASEDDSDIIGH